MDVGGGDIGALQLNAEQNDGEQSENVNISDVLEAITLADPLFGGGVDTMARPPARQPTAEIEEQPASKALRFRYECEGRSAGSIPGANSTAENKSYPSLRIDNYIGPCTIVASCVTKDEPYRPHPHNLVGREHCTRGVCTIRANITAESRTVQFRNLGIQCVKKKDIETALQQRSQLRVDPFRTGFDTRTYQSIELNSVRLAFQVFLPDQEGKMRTPLRAVVSDVIHDKKAMGELTIVRASHSSGPASGGTPMILLCEKVSREEVTVMFSDATGWRAPAIVTMVHKQVAIVLETPPYHNDQITQTVPVEIRLQRGASAAEDDQSRPWRFEYMPGSAGELQVKKRKMVHPLLSSYDPERSPFQLEHIKKEIAEASPPTQQMTSPSHQPHHVYSPVSPYQEQHQRWGPDMSLPMQNTLNPFSDMQWQQFQAIPPQYASPPHLALSPRPAPSPHGASPGPPGLASPAQLGLHSPMHQMGHISPALQQGYQPQQQPPQQHQMDTNETTLSGLLATAAAALPPLASGDLFQSLPMADQSLTDSLNRLTTAELQQFNEF